ncbi:MAG: CinA family protein [Desulfonatronovibrionaceae bacterium]
MQGSDFPFLEDRILAPVARISTLLTRSGQTLAVAESCTAGLLGYLLTSVPGSSAWFAGGIIAYSNRIKAAVLGVEEAVLDEHGAVSRECVLQMAESVAQLFSGRVGIAISGIAGPGGGSARKPVGTVYVAWRTDSGADAQRLLFSGTREEIRQAAALEAVNGLLQRIVA